MKQYLELLNRVLTEGVRKGRPDGYGNDQRIRSSDAVQSGRGIPATHYQEAASEVYHLRIVMVPEWRYQRKISARSWRTHLERVGRRGW